MRTLLLILLLVPMVGFGQTISFDDLKKVTSEDYFKAVLLSDGFEPREDNWGYEINYEGEASVWAYWEYSENILFEIDFWDIKCHNCLERNYSFYNIIKAIKEECSIFKTKYDSETNKDFVLYTCPSSKYKGKIGFNISKGKEKYLGTVGRLKVFTN